MAFNAHRRCAPQNPSRSRTSARRLSCEPLEERLAMYAATGSTWSNPNLSFSYLPDGTASEGYTSTLFSKLDAVAPRDVWQREFARALQTWANVSNLNFQEVADSGAASGGSGAQGNIRLGAHPLGGYLAYAYYPSTSYTIGGDVTLATEHTFGVGANYDLYSVLLHETGHSLGLGHTSGSVMNSSYQGILAGLTTDDIAGIRALYGARSEDSFDAALRNDSQAAATLITVDASGAKSLTGDLTSLADVDYFRVTAPAAFDGSMRAAVDARDISLLQARVLVYDGSGVLIGSANATTYEGMAEVNLSGLAAGQTYYVVADGAVSDAFGMGKYGLSVAFGGVSTPPPTDPPPPPPPPPPTIAADRFEVNDTLATARNLGKSNNRSESGLTLHAAADKDYFRFSAKNSGTFRVTTNYASTAGQHEIRVYNSQQVVIATASGTSVDVALTGGKQYFVQVVSPSGTLDTYALNIQRLAAGALKPASPQRAPLGDGYFADAESAAHEEHDHGGHFSAVDHLLASWQPEQSSLGSAATALTTKGAGVADWSALANRAERIGAAEFSAIPWSNAAVNQVFERLGHKARDGQSETSAVSEWDAEDLTEFAHRLQ
jgi:hypothetical protein